MAGRNIGPPHRGYARTVLAAQNILFDLRRSFARSFSEGPHDPWERPSIPSKPDPREEAYDEDDD
jgi:hypothetical protein